MVDIAKLTVEEIAELKFSEEEMKELEVARKKPIAFDEECPEVTPDMAPMFRRVNPIRPSDKLA